MVMVVLTSRGILLTGREGWDVRGFRMGRQDYWLGRVFQQQMSAWQNIRT